jgi:arylsulfatase A-like enzyme
VFSGGQKRIERLGRRDLLKAAALAPILATVACATDSKPHADSPAEPAVAKRKPRNLLVILSDDQSKHDLGVYGNRDCKTPHLDRLANEGLRCERAYTAVAVCQPSRSALYTGLFPHANGATGFGPIHTDVATWPEMLNQAGVATALIGKLDVDPIEKFPFEFLVKAKDMPSRRSPAVFEAKLREFLAGIGERRFAAVIALVDPHRPFEEEAPATPSTPLEKVTVPAFLWDTQGTRLELAQYYDCVARLDESAGRLLALLDEHGLRDDTLVIFTSDNGASFPFAKSTLYEAGVNMPFIASCPGFVARGRVSHEYISLVDVLPTALDLFDVAPASKLQGLSLLPIFRGETAHLRDAIVTTHTGNLGGDDYPVRSIREERFKYIRNFAADRPFVNNTVGHTATWTSGEERASFDPALAARMKSLLYRPTDELYDLQSDPCELKNLASDAAQGATLANLQAKLRKWMIDFGDPLLATWPA